MDLLKKFSFDSLLDRFDRIGVAYSGGLDSTVLLHLLTTKISQKDKIHAIHVNHAVSLNSDKWEDFCKKNTKELGVNLLSYKLEKLTDPSEDDLRKIRYEKFNQWSSANDIILTAHHKDDQVETIFFRFLRGTGLNGLTGIPAWRKEGNLEFHRPLLGFSKKELREYALLNQLKWIEDESNEDNKISRNFIRNKLLPIAKESWPNIEKSVLHLSIEATRSNSILQSVAEEDLKQVTSKENSYNLSQYRALTTERAENLLYFLFNHKLGLEISSNYLKEINRSLRDSNKLDNLDFLLADKENTKISRLKVLGEEICIFSEEDLDKLDSAYKSDWDLSSKLEIPSGLLYVKKVEGEGIDELYLGQKIFVRGRSGGERCKPFGRNKSQKLKKLFQEYNIPVWQRDRLPLIYIGDKLAAVGDLWVCEEFHTKPNKKGISINWTDNLTV